MAKKKQHSLFPQIIQGLLLLAWAVFLFLSFVSYHDGDSSKNWLGLLGHVVSWALFYLSGLSCFLIPIYLGWLGRRLLVRREITFPKLQTVHFVLVLLSLSILLAMLSNGSPKIAAFFDRWVYSNYYPRSAYFDPSKLRHYLGGVPLHHFYVDGKINLQSFLGSVGTFLVFSALLLFSIIGLTNTSFFSLLERLKGWIHFSKKKLAPAVIRPIKTRPFAAYKEAEPLRSPTLVREDPLKRETHIKLVQPKSSPPSLPQQSKKGPYELPPTSLLTEVKPIDQSALKKDLAHQAKILEETLLSFGIEAKVGHIHCGPTITSFEVHPAVGVKVQKIKALENDIALNLQAKSIRIIAPIPGKAAVGIEVPNPQPQEVGFRELIESYQSSNRKMAIPLLLGKKVNGDEVWADLAKMPHLIIAGATGSGKSVCINTLVMSILMNAHPDEIKIVMVDPKKVELTAYTHLPHMLAPVITEQRGAYEAMNWLVKEMERRYEIFRQLGIRHIHSFNTRKVNAQLEESLDLDIPKKMPFIMVIIDELADLMMISSSDIETLIARLAQMARAVGIHMILATQRPSREVLTGLIKANFPSRIAFKVSSRVNSQIIIDENGAETLLGNGDMLFLPPGASTLVRTQGAFIRDDDINKVIHYICSQAPTDYLISSFDNYSTAGAGQNGFQMLEKDPFFEEAKELVFNTGNASTTFLQRKLKIGYARAASLMDQLEENGMIGPSEGAKPRKIFYPQTKEET